VSSVNSNAERIEIKLLSSSMANLLAKLRIDYASLTMLQGVTDAPKAETVSLHNKILDGFMEGQTDECFVSHLEYKQLKEKTHRQLRLREMMMEHSSDASLVVMSLPMPRQVCCTTILIEFVSQSFQLSRELFRRLYTCRGSTC
jgi:hypothetical protein